VLHCLIAKPSADDQTPHTTKHALANG
jgi:hypothetical protein